MEVVLEEAIVGLIVAVVAFVLHKLRTKGWLTEDEVSELMEIILSFIVKAKDGKVTEEEFQSFVDENLPKIAAKSGNKKLIEAVNVLYADIKSGKVTKDTLVPELIKLVEIFSRKE